MWLNNFLIKRLHVCYRLSVCVIPTHMLTSHDIWRYSLKEVIRWWGWSLHNGVGVLKKTLHRDPLHFSAMSKCQLLSRVWLFAILWTVAHQTPLSIGLSRQQWSGLPFLAIGDPHHTGFELWSSVLRADSLLSELPGKPCEDTTKTIINQEKDPCMHTC